MNYLIVANELAGKGVTREDLFEIEQKIQRFGEVKAYLLCSKDETKDIIDKQRDWLDALVLVGGDGTFREGIRLASELKVDVPVGLIPKGTGNDFVKTLGIPQELDSAIALIKTGYCKKVSAYQINDSSFLNIASIGLDAAIAANQKEIKKRIAGPLSYAISTIVTVLKHKRIKHKITIDGNPYEGDYMLVAFANGKYYGGGMKIAPQASPFDDSLQVVALKTVPKILVLLLFPMLYFGIHTSLWCIEIGRGKTIQIETEQVVAVNMDGDITNAKTINIKKNDAMSPKIYLHN